MKKRLFKGLFALIAILLSYVIIDNMFFPTSISYNEKYYTKITNSYDGKYYTKMIDLKDNIIYVNYSMMNLFLEELNGYIDYGDSLANIYNDIIDKYYNDKKVKLYDEDNYKVLEIKFSKNEAEKLFEDFVNVDKNVIVKVLFNKNWNLKNINLTKVNYKINREDVIRQNIASIAKNEIGNYGSKYWKWYGVNYRMEWCCVFVSWVANESGVMDKYVPRFASVQAGLRYFKSKNQLKYAGKYTPKPGDVVFFDFPSDYTVDHVGLVEKVKDGIVYTIEGNANSDYVKRKEYNIDNSYLYAYGVPDYKNVR